MTREFVSKRQHGPEIKTREELELIDGYLRMEVAMMEQRASMVIVVDVPETESVMLVGGPRTGEWHDVSKGSNRLELTARNKPVVYERGAEGTFRYKGPSR